MLLVTDSLRVMQKYLVAQSCSICMLSMIRRHLHLLWTHFLWQSSQHSRQMSVSIDYVPGVSCRVTAISPTELQVHLRSKQGYKHSCTERTHILPLHFPVLHLLRFTEAFLLSAPLIDLLPALIPRKVLGGGVSAASFHHTYMSMHSLVGWALSSRFGKRTDGAVSCPLFSIATN